MWYALRCDNIQQKQQAFSRLKEMPESSLDTVIPLTYDRMKRYQGAWHCERADLFPNYIVIDSTDKAQLKAILQCPEKELTAINETEEKLLRELCDESGNLAMSQGVIKQGVTLVLQGPLMGKESIITRIDRHKRLATLKLPITPMTGTISAGLEITEKTV